MRHTDEHNITEAVLLQMAACPDARLKQVLTALVCHLHDFVREVRLTPEEWVAGITFLTQTGHMCTDQRQEFILLSDTLGVSMLVTALNEVRCGDSTESTVFGPFHTEDAPRLPQGADLAQGAPGVPLHVEVRVEDDRGRPVADAEVDVWQADEEGFYDVQRTELGATRRARGVMRTDAEGALRFKALVPTPYPVPTDGPVGRMLQASGRQPWRPAHLHFRIRAAGFEPLVTHLFLEGDPYLDSDVVFGVRRSLVARLQVLPADELSAAAPAASLRHRFVLAPARGGQR